MTTLAEAAEAAAATTTTKLLLFISWDEYEMFSSCTLGAGIIIIVVVVGSFGRVLCLFSVSMQILRKFEFYKSFRMNLRL